MIRLQPIAEKIVYDLQAATGQEIELIDQYGRSVATSSPHLHSRLEAFREQGQEFADGLVLEDVENGWQMRLQEITLHEERIGYIAVGGEAPAVQSLERTVRWLCRRLVEEYSGQPGQALADDLRRAYFEDLLFTTQSKQEIRLKAATANLDCEESCYIAVLRIWYDFLEELDIQSYREALEQLTALLDEFCGKNTHMVLLEAPDKRILIADNVRMLRIGISQFAQAVEKKCDDRFRVYAGISNRSLGHYNLHKCYENAAVICDRLANERTRVLAQEECLLELLMEQMDLETKREFVAQVFGDCSEEDVEEWARIVSVLSKNNGSINRSATELFMHKNTLQYRLMRIKERIGLDARVSQDALVLQIAFMARRSVNKGGGDIWSGMKLEG